METNQTAPKTMAAMIVAIYAVIVAFHLGNAMAGKSLYRPIHLGTALNYANAPIDLLRPVIVGFTANEAPAAEEFPAWQAAAGSVFKLTGSRWYGWANLVSLLIFATGIWPYFQLARQYAGESIAWWATTFFLAEPLIILMAGFGSTDGFSLVLTIWFLFFTDKMVRLGKWWYWFPASFFGAWAAVTKLPFFMSAGLCSVLLLLLNRIQTWQRWGLLASSGGVAAVVFFAWNHHTAALAAQAEYPFYELRISHSPHIAYWFFGDLRLRLDPVVWMRGAWRFLHGTMGSLPMSVLFIIGLFKRGNLLAKGWLVATFLTTLVFANVVLVHWHYYLMCCPAVAILCGTTLSEWEELWSQRIRFRVLGLCLAGLALGLSAIDGIITTKVAIYYDTYPKQMAAIIAQNTTAQDKLVVYGGDWGGEELFRAGRRGFYVYEVQNLPGVSTMKGLRELLSSPADVARLKELGYTKLVLMSESPVRFAAVASNPGSKRKRVFYPEKISDIADGWPTLYKSEDIQIKEIR